MSFRNLRALGCSVPRAARVPLRAPGFLNPIDPIGQDVQTPTNQIADSIDEHVPHVTCALIGTSCNASLLHYQRVATGCNGYQECSCAISNVCRALWHKQGNIVNGRGQDNAGAEGECIIWQRPLPILPKCTN